MYKRKNYYLPGIIMNTGSPAKHIREPKLKVHENITEDDIELIVYSFMAQERSKIPKLKPRDERYIIFRMNDELFILTDFSPLRMLQYVDNVTVMRDIIVNGKIESEETDEYTEPSLRDVKDEHIIKWLFDNRHLWSKEVSQCLQRA